MQPAVSRRPDISPQRRRHAHPPALSGARLRLGTTDAEEFSEPDLELVSLAERSLSSASDSEELSKARSILEDRERTIDALTLRITSLESAMADTLESLRGREAELEELRKYLLPTFSAAPTPSVEARRAHAPSVASEPAAPLDTPAAGDESTLLRVSLWLKHTAETSESQPAEFEFADETQFFTGLEQDLTEGGLFVATYRAFPIGSALVLEFELADGSTVRVEGAVRWQREATAAGSGRPGVGVAFTSLPHAARAAIEQFCRVRPPLYVDL